MTPSMKWTNAEMWALFHESLPEYTLLVRNYDGDRWIVANPDGTRTQSRLRPTPMPHVKVFYGDYRLMARAIKHYNRHHKRRLA